MKTAQASFRAQYQVGGGLGARAEGRNGGDDDGGGAFLPGFEFRISSFADLTRVSHHGSEGRGFSPAVAAPSVLFPSPATGTGCGCNLCTSGTNKAGEPRLWRG